MRLSRCVFASAPRLRLAGPRAIVPSLRFSSSEATAPVDPDLNPAVNPAPTPAPKPAPKSTVSKAASTKTYKNPGPSGPPPPRILNPKSTALKFKPKPVIPPQTGPVTFPPKPSSDAPSTPKKEWNPKPAPTMNKVAQQPEDINWEKSYHGLGTKPVTERQFEILTTPVDLADVEVKPDGILYMPEIKYRRRLNEAFGPMGWGIVPRNDAVVGQTIVTREYALIINGCFVSQALGVNNYFSPESIPQAIEGAKSNALMRCCKDLGIASELWDPIFIRWFTKNYVTSCWTEHAQTKKKRLFYYKAGTTPDIQYPLTRTS